MISYSLITWQYYKCDIFIYMLWHQPNDDNNSYIFFLGKKMCSQKSYLGFLISYISLTCKYPAYILRYCRVISSNHHTGFDWKKPFPVTVQIDNIFFPWYMYHRIRLWWLTLFTRANQKIQRLAVAFFLNVT